MKQVTFFMILLLLWIPFGVWADEEKPSSSGTLSFHFENDSIVEGTVITRAG